MVQFQTIVGGLVIFFLLLTHYQNISITREMKWVFVAFGVFASFLLLRLLWGSVMCLIGDLDEGARIIYSQYIKAMRFWLLYIGFFIAGFLYLKDRSNSQHFSWLFSILSSIYAFHYLLRVYIHKTHANAGFLNKFFLPESFYGNTFFDKYIMGKYANVNFIGDLMAFGLFLAIGLFIYHFIPLIKKWPMKHTISQGQMCTLTFLSLIIVVTLMGIFSTLSRGVYFFCPFHPGYL